MLNFRKATYDDIEQIAEIYSELHSMEEKGLSSIGWVRNVYPVRETAEAALKRNDLFVLEVDGRIVGSAIINKQQVEQYQFGKWNHSPCDEEITVLHTLVISPEASGRGYGKAFVDYYEKYAVETNSPYLRIDTNEKNIKAREMYKKLGYTEVGIIKCAFNGIKNVGLVLLEKLVK